MIFQKNGRGVGLDPKNSLVLLRGEDKTDEIRSVDVLNGCVHVCFLKNSSKTYQYSQRNVQLFSNPIQIPAQSGHLTIGGDVLTSVEDILRFDKWVKVFFENGKTLIYPSTLLPSPPKQVSESRTKDILAYFRELSEKISLKTEEGESVLAKKYRHLTRVQRGSILANFFNGTDSGSEALNQQSLSNLIFPFGCNLSQKKAVEKALLHPVSVIQGPPGTGKTQTILNLIGNLLLQGKHVAVVSNNNSATENVFEKLEKDQLGFLAASLGKAENKKLFIENQPPKVAQIPSLSPEQDQLCRKKILELNQKIEATLKAKNKLAAVIQQIDSLKLESAHFDTEHPESGDASEQRTMPFAPKVSSKKLMSYWLELEQKVKRQRMNNSFNTNAPKDYRRAGLVEKIILFLKFGRSGRAFFRLSIVERIPLIQKVYYHRKISELQKQRKTLEELLKDAGLDEQLEQLKVLSKQRLKHCLFLRYKSERRIFTLDDLWKHTDDFLKEYPVVLSTTFSVITSVKSGHVFDCVIVDEASQVDLLNGILAISCANKLVVVGDSMQLPNILKYEDKLDSKKIWQKYELPEHVRFDRHNLLSAITSSFRQVPITLLREHYRCHPKIIQFCNQKFYGGNLLLMSQDHGEGDVLKVHVTAKGRHARGTYNQRQIDEIVETILPELRDFSPHEIGIVSPYREQVAKMRASVGGEQVQVDTVHKYQGREKRAMVITTVLNETNEFINDPQLLNVAVSRAQEKLRLVVSNEISSGQGNIADLVRYIKYNNFEVVPGKVRSIFDLLYADYTSARLAFLKKRKKVSEYDSENLAYGVIARILDDARYQSYGVVVHFPLSKLIGDNAPLTNEESKYATHPWTHTDFLIYRKVDKIPVLAIEVDGYEFHREGKPQAKRDKIKDSVLNKCGIPFLRLSTVGSNEYKQIKTKLQEITDTA